MTVQHQIETSTILDELRTSVRIIKEHQAASGAYPACEEFSAYAGYSWFRDGSFIADAMSRQEEYESAEAFFDWCDVVMTRNSEKVSKLVERVRAGEDLENSDMLPTRFKLDGEMGSEPWWDFQLDGYGTWLWALSEHQKRSGHSIESHRAAIETTVHYLSAFWDRPCFDWWEEHSEARHSSTFGAIFAGLQAASHMDFVDQATRSQARESACEIRNSFYESGIHPTGYVEKWFGSDAVDASSLSCITPFGIVEGDSELARNTISRIDKELCVGGGVHRFSADVFFGGGQWPLLSCFLGWNYAFIGNRARAQQLFDWALAQADEHGRMPEQVTHHLLHQSSEQEWIERWGPSAKPLLWSHAMVLTLGAELGYQL